MHSRNPLALALAIALCLTLAACATRGTQTINDLGRYQEVQPGLTTKPQLHGIFGQPHEVRYNEVRYIDDTVESVWTYFEIRQRPNAMYFIPYVNLVGGGFNYDVTRVDFTFDAGGVLLRSRRDLHRRYVNIHARTFDPLTSSDHAATVAQEMARLILPFDRQEAQRVAVWADLID